MDDSQVQFGYDKPTLLAPDLWLLDGRWSNKFGRKMTVIRLKDGRLVIHNAFRLQDAEVQWLKQLGTVSFIIAPNAFHTSDAGWMARCFPEAQLFVPTRKIADFQKQQFQPHDLCQEPLPTPEVLTIKIDGTRMQEVAFIHTPSRTLIVTDLAFNMQCEFHGLEKWILQWNGVVKRFGPSKFLKYVFTSNRSAMLASVKQLLNCDFDRVIVNHGDVVATDGKRRLRHGFEELFGAQCFERI